MKALRHIAAACAALLLLATGPGVPHAAPAAPPAQGYIPQIKERYRVFVFGDKMATGLLAGLWRVLKNDPRFVARGRLRQGSGLARPRFYNWPRTIAGVLDAKPVDIAIVMLGANDARDIITPQGKLLFGSAEWQRAYAKRVRALMQMIRSRGVALYWVGLPPVRDSGRNEALKYIDEIIRQEAKRAGVRHIGIYAAFATPQGGYAENGPDVNGRIVRLRARGGVQFIKPGNTKLARIVMQAVARDVEEAGKAPLAQEVAPVEEEAPDALSARPLFGRQLPDGRGQEILAAALLPTVRERPHMPGALKAGGTARRNARAQRLLVEGLLPETPGGGVFDFGIPGAAAKKQASGGTTGR